MIAVGDVVHAREWSPSPAAFARYLTREVELARGNYVVQLAHVRRMRAAADRGTLYLDARDVAMHSLASHRTLMLAAEVQT